MPSSVTITVQVGNATAFSPLAWDKALFLACHATAGAVDRTKATEAEIASAILAQLLQRARIGDAEGKNPGSEFGDFLRAEAGRLDGKAEALSFADAQEEGMAAVRARVQAALSAVAVKA